MKKKYSYALAVMILVAGAIVFFTDKDSVEKTIFSDRSEAHDAEKPSKVADAGDLGDGASDKIAVSIKDNSVSAQKEISYDPILAELMVEDTTNPLREYFRDEKDQIIKIIDKDESSSSFGKTLETYIYADGKVVERITYQYYVDETVLISLKVAYKEDGSLDDYEEIIKTVN